MSREQWWLVNLTNNPINIGDLPGIPTIPANNQIEILQHVSKEKINQSQNLIGVVRLGWAKLIKKLDNNTIGTATTVSQLKNITESVEKDELETAVSEGGGGSVFSQDTDGSVPGPTASNISNNHFLKSDGTWAQAAGLNFSGAGVSVGSSSSNVGGQGVGTLAANGQGSTTCGYSGSGATLSAGGLGVNGCFASGVSKGTASILASGQGSRAHGYAPSGTTGNITASSFSSWGIGMIQGSGTITSSGWGSLAIGHAAAGETITASGNGCMQLGPGTNSTADSLKVGDVFHAIVGGNVVLANLPTSDPSVAGALWNDTGDGNTLKVSAG